MREEFAEALLPNSECYSVIGPQSSISFGDAALMWASFYHLVFRDKNHKDGLKGGKIRWALRRICHTFGQQFDYYKPSKAAKGYERVDIEKR